MRNIQFKENGFVIIRCAVKEQTLDLLRTEFKMMEDCSYYERRIPKEDTKAFEDKDVPCSFPWYSAFCFESLMVILQSVVENATAKELFPCYSYARIMRAGASMVKHKDRPSCEYSATICISEDEENPYPIYMEDYSGRVHKVFLKPGDMIVYNGTELNHWRKEYKGKEQIQCFIHYVDANGPYKDHKFDKRPMLGFAKT